VYSNIWIGYMKITPDSILNITEYITPHKCEVA